MKLTLQGLETTQKLYADKQALEEKIQAYNRQLVEYENEKHHSNNIKMPKRRLIY